MQLTPRGSRNVRPARPMPLGATLTRGGVRFAVFARHATRVWLEIFAEPTDREPVERYALTTEEHRVGDIWCAFLEGLGEGTLYGYRVEGPYDPVRGHRYNPYKLLVDPHARAVTGSFDWKLGDARGFDPNDPEETDSRSRLDSAGGCPKSIVLDDRFDWEGDRPPRVPWARTVIYELHVRGFTVDPSSGVAHPGTYQGLVERIPYLKRLGVTAVELLPVQEFDHRENPKQNPLTGEWLGNYWGYSTVCFFAPVSRYSSSGGLGGQVREFKELVKALHGAGIEVILDVVFNHTSEGDETGPTLCFRGLDNVVYYMLEEDRRGYKNYSGCGNTFNCNHPLVRDFILECLRYWVVEMHVDGFRFDLASVLGRDPRGELLANPPLVERIAEDPVLAGCKIIAEAWDAAGAYQVGSFPGERWAEWNGKYRDDVRRFWRGEGGQVPSLATRLAGSADLYQGSGRSPLHSINFVTCHDGFTLADLVTYEQKNNWANGEENRDGTGDNLAWNCGVEGPTDDPEITALRERQVRNFLATLLLSQGVPMLAAGDELGRTQGGNNNAYCQDNPTSWVDWSTLEERAPLVGFVTGVIALRERFASLRRGDFFTGSPRPDGHPDVRWYGTRLEESPWEWENRCLACWIASPEAGEPELLLLLNGGDADAEFEIPVPSEGRWRRLVDTADSEGRWVRTDAEAPGVAPAHPLSVCGHSLALLAALG